MRHPVHTVRALLAAVFVMAAAATAPAFAQGAGANSPVAQGQISGANPTARAVTEEQLFRELDKLTGRVSIPDNKAAILQQPQGREYRQFREGVLPWIGGVIILGMLAALAIFYFTKGRIRLDHSEESGIKIKRFNAFERFTHWMTAFSFVFLALTGLNYVFGKRLLMPLIGPDGFAAWSHYAKLVHNFVSWPFILGLVFMLAVWLRDNFPDRTDWVWLKAGGGFLSNSHPPARRFNAGQKLIFWSVILGGTALAVSGVVMLFPFSAADINGMQLAQYIHATVGMILIGIILAHIYIGSLGMEGAYDAMGSGEVDLAWARAHHNLWVEEEQARTASGRQLGVRTAPAE